MQESEVSGNPAMETEKKSDFKKFNWNELSWKDSFFLSLKTYLYFLLFFPIPSLPIWVIMGSVGFENLSSPILYFVGAYMILTQPLCFVCVFKFRFLKFKISNKKVYIIEESGEKIDCSWLLAFKLGWAHFWKSFILAVFMISANQIYYNFVVPPSFKKIYLLVIIFSLMIVFKWTFSRKFDGLQIKLAQEDK